MSFISSARIWPQFAVTGSCFSHIFATHGPGLRLLDPRVPGELSPHDRCYEHLPRSLLRHVELRLRGLGSQTFHSTVKVSQHVIVFNFKKYVFLLFSRSKWSLSMEIEQRVRTEKSRLISMFSHEPSQVCTRRQNILILLNPVDNYFSS